ncbi:hypothetical protein [Emcibacter sp.]|uniref:hypothetical protein n=1 Tax=Emcibacter sp. TaxID=1979954 RepID=UPI002AA7D4E2|nr:hypothetical protein [Emcibacter sp.]
MNVFEMIVIIVVVTAIAGVLKHWTRGRNSETDRDYSDIMSDLGLEEDYYSKKQIQPHLERIRKLEERVQVLERIATDKGSNLAREIDNLA